MTTKVAWRIATKKSAGVVEPPRSMSEQCLFLNIAAPPDASPNNQYPTMVWIHGGAFMFGSGADGIYRGRNLVHRNVVLVTINYRLGAFGYLNVPGGDKNCGLWDQFMALKFVQSEIANFGGSPSEVTIFGESAGGMSCGALLCSPIAQPYFHRAILMSGAMSNVISADDAEQIAQHFGQHSMGKTKKPSVTAADLRALSTAELLAMQMKFLLRGGSAMPFQPCVDGVLLTANPYDAIKSGEVQIGGKQVMIGSNAEEWALFSPSVVPSWLPGLGLFNQTSLEGLTRKATSQQHLDHSQLQEELDYAVEEVKGIWPTEQARVQIRSLLKSLRQEQKLSSWSDAERAYYTMMVFTAPARLAARALSRAAHLVWVYHYEFNAGVVGAAHASELPTLFGTHNTHWALAMLSGHRADPKHTAELSEALGASFASFAHTGSPTGGLPAWSAPYSASEPNVFAFRRRSRLVREDASRMSSPSHSNSSSLQQATALVAAARRPFGLRGISVQKGRGARAQPPIGRASRL
jgi:para-nitrobenzyl esterase